VIDLVQKNKNKSISKYLKIPILLCKNHFEKNPDEFVVSTSKKWKYIAIPTPKGDCSCHICTESLNEPGPFFREGDFKGKDLRYANFRHGNLANSDFSGSDLRHSDLSNANFANSDFSGANLSKSNCYNANFRYANLRDSNLTETNFYNANLYDVNLRHAKIIKTSFRYANLANSTLNGAKIKDAIFSTAFTENCHGLKISD